MPPSPPPSSPPPRKLPTAAIVGIVIGALMCLCIPIVGVIAAIAVPNFVRFNVRAKQSECKSNLKALFTGQKALYAEKDQYSTQVADLYFKPDYKTRYLYRVTMTGPIATEGFAPTSAEAASEAVLLAGVPSDVGNEVGLVGDCPKCDVTMLCAGNLDGDSTIDVWSISTKDRTVKGMTVPAGQPYNHVDDTRE